jgi:3-hydroxyacyl-CoA dehydrogenase/enoyl-CoA hydratase/3-hydroxybutyryl-CoA epimerase
VNDFRGFYTSRCFGTYPAEGVEMLMEGIAPAIIENVGRQCGMPMGALEVSDSVGLDTALKIGKTNAELNAAGLQEGSARRHAVMARGR